MEFYFAILSQAMELPIHILLTKKYPIIEKILVRPPMRHLHLANYVANSHCSYLELVCYPNEPGVVRVG